MVRGEEFAQQLNARLICGGPAVEALGRAEAPAESGGNGRAAVEALDE